MTEDEFFGRPTQTGAEPVRSIQTYEKRNPAAPGGVEIRAVEADPILSIEELRDRDMRAAFRKGLGDAALSMDVPAESAWQPPEGVTSASNEPATYPDTLDPQAWVDAWEHNPNIPSLADLIRAAIQTGYNAARPLDPGTVYAGGKEIDAKMVFGTLDALKAVDVQPKPFFEGQGEPVDGSIHDRLMTMDVPRIADELHTAIVDARSHPLIPIIEEYMRELAGVAYEAGVMQEQFDETFRAANPAVAVMPEIADRDCSFIENDGDAK